jgi:hypothetical protein
MKDRTKSQMKIRDSMMWWSFKPYFQIPSLRPLHPLHSWMQEEVLVRLIWKAMLNLLELWRLMAVRTCEQN